MQAKPEMLLPQLRLLLMIILLGAPLSAAPTRIILDADTGNEMDDLYAIVRAVRSPELDVVALNSAHFNNPQLVTDERWHIYPTRDIDTVEISQRLNERLLRLMKREKIPHPRGCDRMLGFAWGPPKRHPGPPSPAVDFLIREALALPEGEKLDVVLIGAVTNVAAALHKEPMIAAKLRCHILSMRYDAECQVWNKNSFNARNDLNGLDLLLEQPDLELRVMPDNVAAALTFRREATLERLDPDDELEGLLRGRWNEVSAGDDWIMWDLALIEALINPSLTDVQIVPAPPENGGRLIQVDHAIDAVAMEQAFWKSLD